MIVAPRFLVLAACAVVSLSACSSTDIVSEGPDSIAVGIDDESDLVDASEIGSDHCEDSGRQAVLDHTEVFGDGAIAYFDCQ